MESEAHVSDVSPDNTLKRLVKLGATCKAGRGGLLTPRGQRGAVYKFEPKPPRGWNRQRGVHHA